MPYIRPMYGFGFFFFLLRILGDPFFFPPYLKGKGFADGGCKIWWEAAVPRHPRSHVSWDEGEIGIKQWVPGSLWSENKKTTEKCHRTMILEVMDVLFFLVNMNRCPSRKTSARPWLRQHEHNNKAFGRGCNVLGPQPWFTQVPLHVIPFRKKETNQIYVKHQHI